MQGRDIEDMYGVPLSTPPPQLASYFISLLLPLFFLLLFGLSSSVYAGRFSGLTLFFTSRTAVACFARAVYQVLFFFWSNRGKETGNDSVCSSLLEKVTLRMYACACGIGSGLPRYTGIENHDGSCVKPWHPNRQQSQVLNIL